MAEKCSAIGGKALLTDRHYKFFTVTRLLQMLMYLDLFLEDKFLEKELLAQKLHILWTPERWFWYTYSQGSSGDADIGNRYADMAGGRRGRTNRERGRMKKVAWRHTHTIWKTASQRGLAVTRGTQPGALGQPTGVGWGWERGARAGDVCTPVANACWCMAETSTVL